MPRILLLGESAGSARYLTGTFDHAGWPVRHVEARQTLDSPVDDADVFIFSDFPSSRLGAGVAEHIVRKVESGAGLVMLGGWTSFTGLGGDYGTSPIASLLPVICGPTDDRRNVPGGLWFEAVATGHPILHNLNLEEPPVLCGYNAVSAAPGATVVAQGRKAAFAAGTPVAGSAVPLLAVRAVGSGRVVAYTSDLVPHWCGGIVDWGDERVLLPSGAEVGNGYVTFLSNLVRWAGGDLEV
jgi:uncharacterized membrane protein